MSRTDAHRPYSAWIAQEPTDRIERHDHRNGPCTLDDPETVSVSGSRMPNRCRWELRLQVLKCGCDLCSGSMYRTVATNRTRMLTRILARAVIGGATEQQLEQLESRINRPTNG